MSFPLLKSDPNDEQLLTGSASSISVEGISRQPRKDLRSGLQLDPRSGDGAVQIGIVYDTIG